MTSRRRQEAVDAADAALHLKRSEYEENPCLASQSLLSVLENRTVSTASLEPDEDIVSSAGGDTRAPGCSFHPRPPAMSDAPTGCDIGGGLSVRAQDRSIQPRKGLP